MLFPDSQFTRQAQRCSMGFLAIKPLLLRASSEGQSILEMRYELFNMVLVFVCQQPQCVKHHDKGRAFVDDYGNANAGQAKDS